MSDTPAYDWNHEPDCNDEGEQSLRESDTPRTDREQAAWDRDGGGSIERWAYLARQLERELTVAVAACASSRDLRWGKFKAWIVEGAPNRETGIAAAKQITALNVRLDAVACAPHQLTNASYRNELVNIAYARRFDIDFFTDDTSFADWAQSRCRYALSGGSPPDVSVRPQDRVENK